MKLHLAAAPVAIPGKRQPEHVDGDARDAEDACDGATGAEYDL